MPPYANTSVPDLNLISPIQGGPSNPDRYEPEIASTPTSSYGPNLMYGSMALSAIGALATAFGQSQAAKARGAYEESVSRTNATIAAIQAKQALQEGDILASRKNLETKAVSGALRSRQGASGTDVNVGSNAIVRASVEGVGKTDELTIRNNAARQAWGFETQSIEDTFTGKFSQLTARSQSEQSLLTGGLQAISGPLTIESNYMRFSRYLSGGSGGAGSRLPFDMGTN